MFLFYEDMREHDYEPDVLIGVFDETAADKTVVAWSDRLVSEGSKVVSRNKTTSQGGVITWHFKYEHTHADIGRRKYDTFFRADPVVLNKDIRV